MRSYGAVSSNASRRWASRLAVARERWPPATRLRVHEAWALRGLAEIARRRGDSAKASELVDQALQRFTALEPEIGIGYCLKTVSALLVDGGQHGAAVAAALKAVRLFRDISKPRGVAYALLAVADAEYALHDQGAAHKHACQAHAIFRRIAISPFGEDGPATALWKTSL